MIAFSIGSLDVYWYGIMYFLSFILGYVILYFGQKKGWYQGTDADTIIGKDLDGMILSLLLGVMIGGRMGHIFIYDFGYFLQYPLKIFAFQEGGMSFIGGIVGVVISVLIYLYYFSPLKGKKINILSLFDAFIPIVPIGIFFGRFGNFLNQELYGRIVSESFRVTNLGQLMEKLHLLHVYERIDTAVRFNTNFLSMIFEGAMITIILWILFFRKVVTKKRNSGQLSMIFLGLYSVVRFMLEYLRQDSQAEFIGSFTKSQWFFVVFFIVAVIGFVKFSSKNK